MQKWTLAQIERALKELSEKGWVRSNRPMIPELAKRSRVILELQKTVLLCRILV